MKCAIKPFVLILLLFSFLLPVYSAASDDYLISNGDGTVDRVQTFNASGTANVPVNGPLRQGRVLVIGGGGEAVTVLIQQ